MTSLAVRRRVGVDALSGAVTRSQAVPLLQVFALCVMCIPSNVVIRPIGGVGYPAALVGMFAFAVWVVATMLGIHDPQIRRHPIRGLLCALWLTTLITYVVMNRGDLTGKQLASADRFLMQLAVMTGAALIAAECLPSMQDVRRVLRALSWGGGFSGAVAGLQFWLHLDVTPYLRSIPGFSINADAAAGISARDSISRVAGTATHPIELGVVAGILLPIAIWVAMYDGERTLRRRWIPVALIALAIPASVSRSAILAVALTMGVFIVLMPLRQRIVALMAVPVALAAVFVSAHGLIGTLASYFGMGSSDSSITHRTDNYPYVEHLVRQAPLFGHGGGTYIADVASGTSVHVLDNQYLKTAVELGLVGLVVFAAVLLLPMFVALAARRRSQDEELRLLCAALAGASLAATACVAAFDALSFPMFYNVMALVIGLVGACWRFANSEPRLPSDLHLSRARPAAAVQIPEGD